MCMGVRACVGAWKSPPLALPSYPLRQGVSVKLVLHFSSLQAILGLCRWRQRLHVGHRAQLAFTWVSEDLNSVLMLGWFLL